MEMEMEIKFNKGKKGDFENVKFTRVLAQIYKFQKGGKMWKIIIN